MKRLFVTLGMICLLPYQTSLHAQTIPNPPVPFPTATVRTPQCLQFPDSKTYKPCTGVVPADSTSGNILDWSDLIKGSPHDPAYVLPVIDSMPISRDNPLPVVCQNCSGGSGGGGEAFAPRCLYWNELKTPLDANQTFWGPTHDGGGVSGESASRWSTFACYLSTDQTSTVYIQASDNGTDWYIVQMRTINANPGSVYLSQPIFTKYWRCGVTNGTTDQGRVSLNAAFGL